MKKQIADHFGEQETAKRRDEVIRRTLNTAPKPMSA